MRKIGIALFMAVALLLGCTGCAPSNAQPKVENPPYYEAVRANLGNSRDTVISAMGLNTGDFTEWMFPWVWCYKDTVSYLGYDFMMVLEAQNDQVTAVKYVLYMDNRPEEAAAAVIDLRQKLEGYGTPYDSRKYSEDKKLPLQEITEEELVARFSDPEGTAGLNLEWILSTDVPDMPESAAGSRQHTCVSVQYMVGYPDESGKAEGIDQRVCIALTYGLSYSYKG